MTHPVVTRADLLSSVRKSCLQLKIGLKSWSTGLHDVVKQSMQELLKVDNLSSDQLYVADYFCRNITRFYKNCHSSHTAVLKKHREFFEQPLVVSVDAATTSRYSISFNYLDSQLKL